MIALDEDALICDFAEVYHIYDYRSLPADMVATYAVGLRETSRIKTKMMGMKLPLDEHMLVAIYDELNWLCWTHTKDAQNGGRPPQRILQILQEKQNDEKRNDEYVSFDSVEDFNAARMRLLGE